jgi:hypothetical protein
MRWDVLNRFASALRAMRMSGFMFREMFGLLENLAALLATVLISRHGIFPLRKPECAVRPDALRPRRPVHSYRILKREKIAAYGMGRLRQATGNLVRRSEFLARRASHSVAVLRTPG